MADFEDVLRYALRWPETEASTSYRTPAVKVCKKLMARLREDGVSLAIRATFASRSALPQLEPETFSIPEHYAKTDMLVIHLPSIKPEELGRLVQQAWEIAKPAR